MKRFGFYGKRKIQRYRCTYCSATFSETATKIGSHYTDPDTAIRALSMMLEGVSIRAISRLTGLHLETILALMNTAAINARRVFDERVRNVKPTYVQLDELWSYCGCHGRRLRSNHPEGWGDQWTWLALDSESKMILSYRVGDRNTVNAFAFVKDLSERTVGVYQITADALRGYVGAIEEWFGADVHFAQLRKVYGRLEAGPEWYGGGKVIAAVPRVIMGEPDYSHISTSHLERANLTVRMHLRRFTRKTNAASKKLYNLTTAVTLFVAWYDFCRPNTATRNGEPCCDTPAMRAGLTDHVWGLQELICP